MTEISSLMLPAVVLSVFLLTIFSNGQESPQLGQPDYMRFTFDASMFPFEAYYDYIVVGGGTAGCPLAATLSESRQVLLLERGGAPQEFPSLASQEGFLRALVDTDAPDSPAQSFVSEDGVTNSRGRVLGGSSAINAGFYSRAHPAFFDSSTVSWDMALVNDSYDWVERGVAFRPHIRSWQSAVRDGLLDANITPYNGFSVHHLPGTKIGASTFDSFGRRHSAADLLNFASPDNIRVALRASVDRILFNSPYGLSSQRRSQATSAIGVVYRDRYGRHHYAKTRPGGEVILSAGALGSPQLLLLSGIGPRPYLSSWGIPVVAHHPNVGQFLYDNPRNGISIVPPVPLDHSLIQVVGIPSDGSSFIEAASNVVPFRSPTHSVFLHNPSSPIYLTVATLFEKIPGPSSVGFLRLDTLDVRDTPVVRFNYFSSPDDLARCVVGLRRIGQVLDGRAMDEFRIPEWWIGGAGREFRYVGASLPRNRSDDAAMEDFCRRTVSTIWHYHGGCVVGKVVNGDHRVMGIGSLRVVDGSTFSASPGTNPQATLMMMGRYMGRKIIEERRRIKRGRRSPSTSHAWEETMRKKNG
ncbi:(R)-mandelonitrile lyase-like [Dendrobium catenatum]|uniref:(R)-mandelonitrile lyase-like n=1 Tax=Dendrobium catenatum TaxID=906689 RepID=UPI00109F7592|nr:(R)-mandelonitrile lyase-like [Dendrobium catenatum]